MILPGQITGASVVVGVADDVVGYAVLLCDLLRH